MIKDGTVVNADISASAAIGLSKLATGALPSGITVVSSNIVDGTIVNADINASAAIADTKLATISTAGKVSNSATTATSSNTANAIVTRNASGNFTAGTITANLSGNVTGNLTGTASAIADNTVTSAKIVDGAIVNADINNSAAIALSKLATGALPTAITVASANIVDGTIVNADINASAAIAGTKISPSFGSQNVVTTGTSTAASLIPTGSTAPTNGVYLPAANSVAISTDGSEQMRIRSDGNIGIGTTGSVDASLRNGKPITGAAVASANLTVATVQSDVTTTAFANRTVIGTAAANFTLSALEHYRASQGTLGAQSKITIQYGFAADASLVGAATNYGFFSNIASATGRWNFWANNTAPNYFAGNVRTNTVFTARAAAANSNVTATATAASLLDGLRTGTPAANINLTLPTGLDMDAAFQELQNNQSFEWSLINLAAATHVITVVANTTHTVVGRMGVAANSSGRFLTRKTAVDTFISYRIA
jgi:hypothetical protein